MFTTKEINNLLELTINQQYITRIRSSDSMYINFYFDFKVDGHLYRLPIVNLYLTMRNEQVSYTYMDRFPLNNRYRQIPAQLLYCNINNLTKTLNHLKKTTKLTLFNKWISDITQLLPLKILYPQQKPNWLNISIRDNVYYAYNKTNDIIEFALSSNGIYTKQ